MIRRLASLFALLAFAAPQGSNAETIRGHFLHRQFHAMEQVNLTCAAGLLCEIVLQPGERLRDSFIPDPKPWGSHNAYEGSGELTVHVVLTPSRPGLNDNLIITTTRRVYRLYLHSVVGDVPTYLFYHYDDESRAVHHVTASHPVPAPTPFSFVALCARDSSHYQADGQSSPWRPVAVCNDDGHTYLQLAHSSTLPTDMPVVFARLDSERKDQVVNWTYDAINRVYHVDGVFEHLVLAIGRQRIDVIRARAS